MSKKLLRFASSILLTTLAAFLLIVFPAPALQAAEMVPPGPVVALPPSCLPDFSGTLDAPAGKHGYLRRGNDGHFYWTDGTRARFWGINVSSTRLNVPPQEIEQVASNFARAGLNMVRLEAIDNRNCLLGKQDAPDSLHFDAHYMDCIDRWIAALKRHGLYYYLDLLDFRTFKKGDGVLNSESFDRGARPYALFDPYLIQLQKEYATHLLQHRNPYTRMRIVDDPAFALVEICNEHGFFLYPEKLEALVEPYASDLLGRWSDFLKQHYSTREALEAAWGQVDGQPVLRPEEDPDKKTVLLPLLANLEDRNGPEVTASRRGAIRRRDGVEFLALLQRAYFREMMTHLKSIGVKIPITAVVTSDIAPDVASVAEECDFTSENWYGEGINGDPKTPGFKYYGNRNSIRTDDVGGFAPYTAALRWNNKPVVVREWASTWPNQYRSVSVPEALAYSSLQDFDAVLLFGYQTNTAPNGAEADALNDFAFQNDPTVWGLHALAGQAFLKGAIRPAQHTVTLVYPTARQFTWPNRSTDLRRIAYCARMNSILSDIPWGVMSPTPTGTGRDLNTLRAVLAELKKLKAPVSPDNLSSGVWQSDTGQIARYTHEGRLEVHTPTLSIIAGDLSPNTTYDLGVFKVSTPTHFGTILAFALDGRPLKQSRHIALKMVSRAANTGEVYEPSPQGSPSPFVLRAPGTAPVVTLGKTSVQPTRIWLSANMSHPAKSVRKAANGQISRLEVVRPTAASLSPMLMLYLEDGTWELEINDGKSTFACDTAGIAGNLQGRAFTTMNAPLQIAEKTGDARTP